ncbi:RNA 2',3'-cyclic phosphodiesterase [Herbidospora galbida]|uniref:RNA 2',3'-cyclic phosphodiesterase n=1 Tax=Herbidospora galbida TaxID=2575442 RepID=A0A4U3ME24_9ACTN|nr:RNA 2',3'-cyclic phosphodiesterase [Herbidospora galbida]TKK87608.1 RNA 2',3'-cyclic phosphodiesterase [Herbidospora galbida]
MSRMFVALVPPAGVLEEVSRAVTPLREAWPGPTWIEPANWHITLAFLGEVPDRVRPDLSTRLARAAGRHEPLPLALGEAGTFTGRGGVGVLWLGVREPGRLARLAGSIAAGARRAGAGMPEGRPYRAHFTLVRSRKGADLRPLADALSTFESAFWTADAATLFVSHLGPPLRYEAVETYPLGKLQDESDSAR